MTPESRRLLSLSVRRGRWLIAVALFSMIPACRESAEEGSVASEASLRQRGFDGAAAPSIAVRDMAVTQSAGPALPTRTGDTVMSLIIRTGDARVEVDDIRAAVTQLSQLMQRLGGHVANSTYQGGRYEVRSATLELKVPAARYDEAVSGLDPLGRVEYVNTRSEDVGEEYYDASARLANARRLEERLIALLATRTGKLEDVLAVERELARVRGEIEQIEGRLRFLRTRAALSTLTVNVHEREPLLGGRPGENPFAGALRQAWRNFVGFFVWLVSAMGVIIPLAVFLAFLWIVARRLRGRLRRRNSAAHE